MQAVFSTKFGFGCPSALVFCPSRFRRFLWTTPKRFGILWLKILRWYRRAHSQSAVSEPSGFRDGTRTVSDSPPDQFLSDQFHRNNGIAHGNNVEAHANKTVQRGNVLRKECIVRNVLNVLHNCSMVKSLIIKQCSIVLRFLGKITVAKIKRGTLHDHRNF